MAGGNSPHVPYASESHIYQHPLDPPEQYPIPEAGLHAVDDSAAFFSDHQHLSDEEKKEHLVVARNSLELLSSILNSDEAEPKLLKEDITLSLLDRCKQSLSVIKGIVESTTNDEATLFEALYLNDELQQVLSKYEELEGSQRSGAQQTQNADTAKHDAETVQNPSERCEGDESKEPKAAQNLDRKLLEKLNNLEVNATEADGHVETKIVDGTKEKDGESSFKSNTE